MSFQEAKKAFIQTVESNHYEQQLQDVKARNGKNTTKVFKPESMPWENSRQGIIKHLFNEKMNVPAKSIDAYMQLIPPGSRSGKHRHMSEEYIFVLEGRGYDLHWDVDYDIRDQYYWKVDETPARWEWEEGDSIYVPPNTVHQHFNADPQHPVRLLCATSRMVRLIGFDDLEQIEDAPEFGSPDYITLIKNYSTS